MDKHILSHFEIPVNVRGFCLTDTRGKKTQRIAGDEMRGENRENEKCNGEKKKKWRKTVINVLSCESAAVVLLFHSRLTGDVCVKTWQQVN